MFWARRAAHPGNSALGYLDPRGREPPPLWDATERTWWWWGQSGRIFIILCRLRHWVGPQTKACILERGKFLVSVTCHSPLNPIVLTRLNSPLTMALRDMIQINPRLNMDLWNLIQNDWRHKKLPELGSKSTYDSTQISESWFESTNDSMMLFIPSFVWPFLTWYWSVKWLLNKLIRNSSWLKQ